MKVVLTKPWLPVRQRMIITLPFASLYLASYLKRQQPDLEVKIADPDIDTLNDENRFYRQIVEMKPEVIGVTIFSHTVLAIQRIFSDLKKSLPGTIFIGGGPHINSVGKNAFKELPNFDYFIRGEGELGFNDLCLALKRSSSDLSAINGLVYRENGVIIENKSEFCQNIDLFDPLDYSLIDPARYLTGSPTGLFHKGRKVMQIITTRGCPFLCTYCAAPVNTGRIVRKRSTSNILNEIVNLRKFGVDEVHLMDDNFTFSKDHVISLCQALIEHGIKMPFALPNGVRLDKLDEEMLAYMKKAGFYHIGSGIEVGSEESLKKIKKNLRLDVIKEKVNMIKKYGFGTTGFFMMGFPFETREDIEDTVNMPEKLGLDLASFGNFTPLPGTEIYSDLVKAGEIEEGYLPSFPSGKVTYSPRGISKEQLAALQKNAVLKYYLKPRMLFFIIKRLHFNDIKYVIRRLYQIIFRPEIAS
ncbi:MAG: radical SAM protein [bacterium]|nr:radical SAM protein [bacterium]